MKKFVRVLAVVAALVMIVACFAACGKNSSKKYIIYSDNGFAPFEFLDDETGKYIGVDMDLLAAIAKDQGFEYEMHNEGFNAAMGAVQSGQANAMIAGMTITDERKENYDFSDGYFEDGSVLVVAKDSAITSKDELAGKKVAAKAGTVSTTYAESLKDEIGFEITYFESSAEMYQAVISGNAVACFEDRSVICWAIDEEEIALKTVGDVVNPKYYGFAVKKGTYPELIEMFNEGLKNIKASGEYDKILAKYGY